MKAKQMMETPGAQATLEGAGNIFVIDDDPVFVSYASTVLAQAGHRVETATDPVEGFNKELPFKPDIILIDIMMPNLSGLQLMDSLKEACQEQGIKLIAVSGLQEEEDIAKAFLAGASDYIVKPIDQSELLFRINHQLSLLQPESNGASVELDLDALPWLESALSEASESGGSVKPGPPPHVETPCVTNSPIDLDATADHAKQPGLETCTTAEMPSDPPGLPAPDGPQKSVQVPGVELPGDGPRTVHQCAKILLVEDDPATRTLVQTVLTARGHTVLPAKNGQQALFLAERDEPDVIILDLVIPDMNGYEVCRRLANNPLTAFIPIVILTAKSSSADVVRGLTSYADEYITKPFIPDELAARLVALLRRTFRPTRSKRERLGVIQRLVDHATRRGYTVFSRHLNQTQDPPSDWTGTLPDIICYQGTRRIAYLVESLESLHDERTLARWEALETKENLHIRLIVTSTEAKNLALLLRQERGFRAQIDQAKPEDPYTPAGHNGPSTRSTTKNRPQGIRRWLRLGNPSTTSSSKNGRRRRSSKR